MHEPLQQRSMLLRDIKDKHYPWKEMDPGFEVNRRWEEHSVAEVTPAGVYFKQREWYAYLDENKREWEYSRFVDLTLRKNSIDKANRRRLEDEGKFIESYWRHLPRAFQARLKVFGFVHFEAC